MRILERIRNEQLQDAEEAIHARSLHIAMIVFEHIEETGGAPINVEVKPAPNGMNQKIFFESVRERTALLVDSAPTFYAGKLVLNQELTDEKSLVPIGLGNEGWLWDVTPEGGTFVFTPYE